MDEHLRQVGPVRLVLRLVEHELDRADDSGLILATSSARLPAATRRRRRARTLRLLPAPAGAGS